MLRPRALAGLALGLALLPASTGCGPAGEPGPEPEPPAARALAWERVGVFPVGDDGRTGAFEVLLPPGARSVSVRASAPGEAAGGACFALEGQSQPASHGYGLWVLPSELEPASAGEARSLRVSLRDCRFDDAATRASHPDMPRSVLVERLVSPEPPAGERAVLPARIAWLTPEDGDRPEDEAMVEGALAEAKQRLAGAGVELRVDLERSLSPLPEALEYGPGAMDGVDRVHHRAMAALLGPGEREDAPFVPLLLVPCLVRLSPEGLERLPVLGQAVRVPGGAPVGGAASGVMLSLRPCEGGGGGARVRYGTTARMGDVIAHEIGHFLGLVHDEDLDAEHAPASTTLMTSRVALLPAGTLSLSAAQASAAARHPLLELSPRGELAPMHNRSGALGQGVDADQEASSGHLAIETMVRGFGCPPSSWR